MNVAPFSKYVFFFILNLQRNYYSTFMLAFGIPEKVLIIYYVIRNCSALLFCSFWSSLLIFWLAGCSSVVWCFDPAHPTSTSEHCRTHYLSRMTIVLQILSDLPMLKIKPSTLVYFVFNRPPIVLMPADCYDACQLLWFLPIVMMSVNYHDACWLLWCLLIIMMPIN